MEGDGFPPPSLTALAKHIFDLLRRRGEKVCLVETACGGLLSATLLAQPGASAIFAGSQTLYTLPSRIALADWTPSHIAQYAGPTPALVEGLCASLRTRLAAGVSGATGADGKKYAEDETKLWALGESGTAGPTRSGEGRNRTPGYVALAVVGPGGVSVGVEEETQREERVANMVAFAAAALRLLLRVLEEAEVKEGRAAGGPKRTESPR